MISLYKHSSYCEFDFRVDRDPIATIIVIDMCKYWQNGKTSTPETDPLSLPLSLLKKIYTKISQTVKITLLIIIIIMINMCICVYFQYFLLAIRHFFIRQ